jgi:hypothetical protein
MTTWVNSQFPRPDFHRLVQRHYGLQYRARPREATRKTLRVKLRELGLSDPMSAEGDEDDTA